VPKADVLKAWREAGLRAASPSAKGSEGCFALNLGKLARAEFERRMWCQEPSGTGGARAHKKGLLEKLGKHCPANRRSRRFPGDCLNSGSKI
jgi:hypothetical protein